MTSFQQVNYDKVPVAHMRDGVCRYLQHGIQPGHFLMALFSDRFLEACKRADDENLAALGEWASFIYNEMPHGSHGSPAIVERWIRRGGIEGWDQEPADAELDEHVPF